MLYLSSLLQTNPTYNPAADRLFAALVSCGVNHTLLSNTRDIWLRDFMPVKTKSGVYVSFRYEPSYLQAYLQLRTDFRREVAPQIPIAPSHTPISI